MNEKTRAAMAHGRRDFFTGLSASAALMIPRFGSAAPLHDTTYAQDFDELWGALRDRYCFFDEKRTDWNKVREYYRPRALAVESGDAFEAVVGQVLGELYDAHTHLNDPPDGTRRWPLYDLMAERAGPAVRVAAVQPGSAAADAGIRIGDFVTAVGGTPIDVLVRDIAPKCLSRPDPAADAWALNVAVAGRRAEGRQMTVQSPRDAPRQLMLPLKQRPSVPSVESRGLDDGIGYIAIHTFADTAVVAAFEKSLAELRECRGLLLDVRGNGGGDTAVARPLMGRFIDRPRDYAMMRRREAARLGEPWMESVQPRGPFTYTRPVVVLVDHWSGSMAEGFAMGMRGMGRASIVGTAMMGLGAAVFSIRLDRTGVQAQYSGEPVYDGRGNPRWLMQPDVAVPEGADILAAGIKALKAQFR